MDSLNILDNNALKLLEKNKLLIPLIKKEIIRDRIKSINLTDDQKSDLKKKFLEIKGLTDTNNFSDWLTKNNTNEKELLDDLSIPLKIEMYNKENFSHRAHAHFLSRKSDLDQVVYSLVRIKNNYEAKELFLRIQGGESTFSEIAKLYSQGPERNSLGIVGPVSLTKGHPKIVEICKSCKVGEMVEPFKLGEWWIILRLETLIEAVLDTNMESAMINELCEISLTEEAEIIFKGFNLIS